MLDLSYIIQDMTTETKTEERTEERKNRFNGESVMLTREEARRHDLIFLAEMMAELHTNQDVKEKHYKIMHTSLITKVFPYSFWICATNINFNSS